MWSGIAGLALLAGFLAWLLRGRKSAADPEPEYHNYEEMEAARELRDAEQEVQELDSAARPDDEQPGDDWGPGTARSYH